MKTDVRGRPRRWRVLTQAIDVSYHADIAYEGDHGEHLGALGVTTIDEGTIVLAQDQSPDKLAETELHEMLHVVFNFAGLQLTYGHDRQEVIVKRMAPILLAALRDNPRLVELWLGRRILGKGSAR